MRIHPQMGRSGPTGAPWQAMAAGRPGSPNNQHLRATGRFGGQSRSSSTSARFGRIGMGAGAALMALSQGQRAIESLRYGEIGQTAIHATLAGGGALVAYHALANTPRFRSSMGSVSKALMRKNAGMAEGPLKSLTRNLASWLKTF